MGEQQFDLIVTKETTRGEDTVGNQWLRWDNRRTETAMQN